MSRYDLFRRRIAPIAFFLAIALIARDSCEKDRRIHTTVELDLGDARSQVREVSVDVLAGTPAADIRPAPVATNRCTALPDSAIGPCRFPLALSDEDGQLRIDVDLGGQHRHITRSFHAIEGSTLVIPLGDDLKPR